MEQSWKGEEWDEYRRLYRAFYRVQSTGTGYRVQGMIMLLFVFVSLLQILQLFQHLPQSLVLRISQAGSSCLFTPIPGTQQSGLTARVRPRVGNLETCTRLDGGQEERVKLAMQGYILYAGSYSSPIQVTGSSECSHREG